jgi:uncharacterized protein (TIGR02646 family)
MRIERSDDPGPFAQPRSYVTHLRLLFRHRCAYCRTWDDQLGGEEGMKVDHFRAESRHPDLRLEWVNLYYCCDVCNNRKGNYPTDEEMAHGQRFVDPCAEDPDEHFQMVRDQRFGDFCRIVHRSTAARYTIRRLHFNNRTFLRDLWRKIDADERILTERMRVIQALNAQLGGSDLEAQNLLSQCETELASIRERRPFPLG